MRFEISSQHSFSTNLLLDTKHQRGIPVGALHITFDHSTVIFFCYVLSF